ncbi:hypothetical protein [Kitasatospora griseola]|uniref:hypothetical protein n=1 Tax=Kitasatospora griseola TaxID=2064 RepID=UPI003413C955
MSDPTHRHRPDALRLLAVLAERDTGDGQHFDEHPNDSWRLRGTGLVVRIAAFRELSAGRLIDVGDWNDSPVKITELGRAFHAAVLEEA